MLHPLVRWLSRRSLRWFYREMHFVGTERLPVSGPVIFVLNHGNDLPDVLVGFLTCPRDVRFVANVAAAEARVANWVYRGLGVIPVTRIRDARRVMARGADGAAMNSEAFQRVLAALRRGDAVGIFPEGGVSNTPYLAPFKSGLSIMALKALDDGAIMGLRIVPIGIQYEKAHAARSDVIAVVGEPMELDQWRIAPNGSRAKELTNEAFRRLSALTRNAPTDDALRSLHWLLAALGGAEAAPTEAPLAAAERVRSQLFSAMPAAANGWSGSELGAHNAIARQLEQMAVGQCDWIARARGNPESARDHAQVLCAASEAPIPGNQSRLLRLVLLAPFALAGWTLHAVPFGLSLALADRQAVAPSERAARAILPGLFVVLGWYLVAIVAAVAVGGWPWLLLIAVLPRLGDCAVAWRDDLKTWRLGARVRRWSLADRLALLSHTAGLRAAWHTFRSALDAVREAPHINSSVVSVSTAVHTATPSAGLNS